MGLIPANTVLPPLNPGVVAWNTLSDSDKALYARYEEAYAAWVSTLDRNFGRLYSYLESSGQLNNTIIVFASDNGGSQEGGLQGTTIALQTLFGGPTNKTFDANRLDLIGGELTSPHYPVGWATVSNTPFRGYKQNTTGGGRRVPLIVSWPGHITDKGAIRTQLTHVTDITPTLLEATGIAHPDTLTFANGDWAEQPDITPLLNPYWNPFGNPSGIHTSGDYSIQATVHYAAGNKGIIFADGADDIGSILYIENGELAFENVAFGNWTRFARVPLQPGTLNIQFTLRAAAYNPANGLASGGGTGTLYVNGTQLAQGTLPAWSANAASFLGESLDGLDIGKDRRGPVSWDIFKKYGVFKYSGVIDQVTVTPGQLPY